MDISTLLLPRKKYAEAEKVLGGADALITNLELFDIWRGQSIGEGKKSLAFHVTLQSPSKTLSDNEIDAAMNKIKSALKQKLRAEIRS